MEETRSQPWKDAVVKSQLEKKGEKSDVIHSSNEDNGPVGAA